MIIILGPNINFNLFFSNNDIDILIFNMNMIYIRINSNSNWLIANSKIKF